MRWLAILHFLGVVLTGCATHIPQTVREPAPGDLSLAAVRQNLSSHRGQPVRWGGTIAAVENRQTETWIEIVGRELDGSGRPRETDHSEGRFVAQVQGFLDPAVYAVGRSVTVAGTVSDETSRPIGGYLYSYPVVSANLVYLWGPLPEPRRDYYDPYWPHPWDPWYPSPYWHPWRY
jgi:outer membrane lipoprotein